MIKKRQLGKTNLLVSEISLGGFQLGEKNSVNSEPNNVVQTFTLDGLLSKVRQSRK